MIVTVNGTEFIVLDSKMELVKAFLFEVCSGAQNTPKSHRAWDYGLQSHIRVPGFNVHRDGCVTDG